MKFRVKVWKCGDVVRLKSGGPKMTVQSVPYIGPDTTAYSTWCVWFDGMNRDEGSFDSESIVAVRR